NHACACIHSKLCLKEEGSFIRNIGQNVFCLRESANCLNNPLRFLYLDHGLTPFPAGGVSRLYWRVWPLFMRSRLTAARIDATLTMCGSVSSWLFERPDSVHL